MFRTFKICQFLPFLSHFLFHYFFFFIFTPTVRVYVLHPNNAFVLSKTATFLKP